MIDQGNLYERADAIGKKAADKTHKEVYESALVRLVRSKPIIDILQQHDISAFIGPMTRRGFYVVVREEEPGFVAHIEETVGKSLDTGTILYPCGFGEYVERLKEVEKYQKTLGIYGVKSEIITIPNPGTEEDMAVLYVPLFWS